VSLPKVAKASAGRHSHCRFNRILHGCLGEGFCQSK
jgi:hypothetical protein